MMLWAFLLLLSVSFGAEFIVKLKPGADESALAGYRVIKRFKNYALVEIPQNRVNGFATLNPAFEYAVRNVRLKAFVIPNDPKYSNQQGLALINAERAWDINTDCSSVVVAVIDTGVDYQHTDLADNIWTNQTECTGSQGTDDDGNGFVDDCYGWDFVNSDPDPMDDHWHGTHVAGIIGAVGNNSTGVTGTCWQAKIMALKILDASGGGTAFDFLLAVRYAVDNGARVINSSLGTQDCNITDAELQPLRDAVEYANSNGVIIVTAAGNSGSNNDTCPTYPASFSRDYSNVISVASVDQNGSLSGFSNYGQNSVDLGAPGEAILSTITGNGYTSYSGTSMATPFVAGAVAHILSMNPSFTPSLVKNRLLSTARKNDDLAGKVKSGGYLDLYAAITGTVSSGGSASPGNPADSESSGGGGGCNSTGGSNLGFLALAFVLIVRKLLKKLPN